MGTWQFGPFRTWSSEQEPLARSGGEAGRCASAAASPVQDAGDSHTGDSGNTSSRGPWGDRAATGAPALQNAVITSRLKKKICGFLMRSQEERFVLSSRKGEQGREDDLWVSFHLRRRCTEVQESRESQGNRHL